jgi:hypothetical protein
MIGKKVIKETLVFRTAAGLDFAKTYATGILHGNPLLFRTKEWMRIMMESQTISIRTGK